MAKRPADAGAASPRWMARMATVSALMQLERDLFRLNEYARAEIDAAERRIKGRVRLVRRLRRYWRNQGLVNVSDDSANPRYVRRGDIG